ncbi:MAG: hypothetical protein HYZ15_14595 [Sphingobacteriales bacterium]|nr:hypothetical protein [Sphingobacteriales bacterium]
MSQRISQSPGFKYRKSYKTIHWGCSFDSLLELKYAISIRDEFEFMRSRLHIYYDQRTLKPTNYLRTGIKHYTPDFLIRNKVTGEAFLIEVKPRAFAQEAQLKLRKQVAENFIRWKKYDWQYKVVYDDEIVLDEHNLRVFEDCCRLKSKSSFKLWLQQENARYDRSAPLFFKQQLSNKQIAFIMFGKHDDRTT